ncbi:enoyl-CoA hydratase/isomerase family protein [Novosphingobium sp. ERN07]|uniref:enoyl-CoA hydratase/isomerase family protein n=1 Tax=Novosphingobium sp. ERN07 TaxID=2726187 RepID=UPI00145759C0|nr:enoyl-CoA hydratase/isomerase family protein [Novosphingobium sp. ERN07]NLR73451.1 enoyl-CoA hydratase/isomerase family protein [Novosphingobium sp. ERN07]
MELPEGLDYTLDDDGIALITLNRPYEGNALTNDMHKGLRTLWRRVDDDPAVKVVIVTGAGEKHFCTGGSVAGLSTDGETSLKQGTLEETTHWSPYQNKVWKPIICCVNGLVNGAGFHFVVDSDIVIASSNAQFMDTHTSVGQVGALENMGIAMRSTMGTALLLTFAGKGYRMEAERAYQVGLVDILEPDPTTALARAHALARTIAANSPVAIRLSKQAIWGLAEQGYGRALENGWQLLRLHWGHPDFDEGPRSFRERRKPAWNPDPNARR